MKFVTAVSTLSLHNPLPLLSNLSVLINCKVRNNCKIERIVLSGFICLFMYLFKHFFPLIHIYSVKHCAKHWCCKAKCNMLLALREPCRGAEYGAFWWRMGPIGAHRRSIYTGLSCRNQNHIQSKREWVGPSNNPEFLNP